MGYGIFPDLTDPKVVCQGECAHRACAVWKKAKSNCNLCGEPLKAGDKVFIDPTDPTQYQHARCVWKAADEARDQVG